MRQASLKDALKKHTYGRLHVCGNRGGWGMRDVMVWLCLRVSARVRDSARQLAEQQEGLLIPADR